MRTFSGVAALHCSRSLGVSGLSLPLPGSTVLLRQSFCLAAVTGNSTSVVGGGAAGFGSGLSLGGAGGASKGGFSANVNYGTAKGGQVSGGTSILRKTTTVKTSSRRY